MPRSLITLLFTLLIGAAIAGSAAQSQTQDYEKIPALPSRNQSVSGDTIPAPSGLHWRPAWAEPYAEQQAEPVVIAGGVRRPLLFFRELANRSWRAGALFLYLFILSGLLKMFLPRLSADVASRCRSNLFSTLSASFIYCAVLFFLIRFAFSTSDLNAMGVFLFGLLQLSFAVGCCFGVNLFAHNLYTLLTSKKAPGGTIAKALLYSLCLLVVAGVLALISMVPNLGHLPRIGNRIVMLVGALGLGGLVSLGLLSQRTED